MKFNSGKGSVYKLIYHLVLCTKYRKKLINESVQNDIRLIINSILTKNGIVLMELNGEEDHIHILLDCPPTIELSKLINVIKTVSSREIKKKHKALSKLNAFWSPSYFIATSGEATLEVLKNYIKNQ